MANRLEREIEQNQERILLSLTGNWHNQLLIGSSFDAEYKSAGYLLKQALPETPIVSLDMIYDGGTAWVCLAGAECGPVQMGSIASGNGIKLFPPDAVEPYSCYYFVGPISAAAPAFSD